MERWTQSALMSRRSYWSTTQCTLRVMPLTTHFKLLLELPLVQMVQKFKICYDNEVVLLFLTNTQRLWPLKMILLCLWILWARNLDRRDLRVYLYLMIRTAHASPRCWGTGFIKKASSGSTWCCSWLSFKPQRRTSKYSFYVQLLCCLHRMVAGFWGWMTQVALT